jgi:hypothetical protein
MRLSQRVRVTKMREEVEELLSADGDDDMRD